jgi:hypothetical protein
MSTGSSFGGRRKFEGPGGTPGGVGEFLLGLGMAAVGIYLLFQHVQVHTSFWNFGTTNSFGLSLLPLLLGIGILFFSGRSLLGWLLTVGGLLFILAGIIMNMNIYFQRTSLWNTLIMLTLLVGGLGLIARSLRPHASRTRSE